MSTKLELTEPIRKAMARRLCESLGLDEEVGLYEVDHMIAAAISIPELPVGTITLRPDGKWVGVRDNKRRGVPWLYCPLSDSAADWPALRAADSWRVIHNPTNPGCPECSNYAAVGLELVEKLAAAEGARLALEEIVSKCKCGADSRAQQEPSIDDAIRVDDIPVGTIARRPDGAWVAHRYANLKGEGHWNYFRVDYNAPFRSPGDADSWPVIYDPTKPDPLETFNQQAYFDDSDELPGSTAQQEPEVGPPCDTRGWPREEVAKPRTPRVVDRLGVDERDAEWTRIEVCRDTYVWEYRFRHGVWKYRQLGHKNWIAMKPGDEPLASGPFTEVVE
ncbi:hypothetical protein [Mycobacteroides abscessus]|uniref:hypothetical protein n=1 Tax=Mycobacteroides abscessus TaxID=36809 RepID=UPI0010425C28|nr:hypothetical protein [Mycobacteroides abscessus]